MHEEPSQNPYAAGGQAPYAESVSGPPAYPTLLRVYAILVLILGILGIGASFSGIATNLVTMAIPSLNSPDAETDSLVPMQAAIPAVSTGLRIALIVVAIVQFACCVALVVGSIMLLLAKPKSGRIFTTACVAVMIYELIDTCVSSVMMFQSMKSLDAVKEELANPTQGPAPPPGMLEATFMIAMVVGIVITVVWLLMKLALYFLAARYVSRPEIKAFLAEKA